MSTPVNFIIRLLLLMLALSICDGDDSYQSIKSLQDRILSAENYSTTIRPVKNQTNVLTIDVSFSLVAIVSVDDVRQELATNGFIFLFWDDEITRWDKSDYGGYKRLSPDPKQIWRPRVIIINTLGDRDPFEDDYSHVFIADGGSAGWVPGGILKSYCPLKMRKFPFDVQTCQIQMSPVNHAIDYLQFSADDKMNLAFYYPNPGWELLETKVTVENVTVVAGQVFSCPTFTFKIKRRPTTIILNVILPVMFMSVLNNLVFLIPGDSGEKISYAITVLLSLSVFLSMVSTMTPQVSDSVPALTIYLFVLLMSSVVSVAAVIFTVYLHNKEEKEDASINAKINYQQTLKKITNLKNAVTPLSSTDALPPKKLPDNIDPDDDTKKYFAPGHNKYRLISKHIDKVLFVGLTCVWLVMTMWFFIYATS